MEKFRFSVHAACASALLGSLAAPTAHAVCLWADVGGERLGRVGRVTGAYSTAVTTLDRTLDFNTQATGRAVFCGYIANQVKLTRTGQDGRPHSYEFGTVGREMTGGGWTRHGDLSGGHTYQPSWMVMQTPLVTRIYSCQPHKGSAGDFRMAGGQGAQWSTSPQPWINDVKFYADTRTRLEVTGYGVVWQGVNYNFVTMIDVDARWPCEIMKDFSLPTGVLALKGAASGNSVDVQWDAWWGCGTGTTPGPETHSRQEEALNRPPTVTLKAIPDRGEPTLTTTFTATARDPDGDPVEYRFRLPDGTWTPWGPENTVTTKLSTVGTHTAKVEVTDIKGAPATSSATVRVENPEVYIFGNYSYPVSTQSSYHGNADYSVSLADEYGRLNGVATSGFNWGTNFGGIFGRLSPAAKSASEKYGGMFSKMVVISSSGDLVGVYDTSQFLSLNAGFHFGLYNAAANLNSYKGKVATLPGGQKTRVLENAMSSPLLVDQDGSGTPSLLADRGWQTPRDFSPCLTDYRLVNLDNGGKKWWEWVGPRDALLVDLTAMAVSPENVSKFVFGNWTWGKKWPQGFAPLATLDKNNNGQLEGTELSNLGLWTDTNSNAIPDDGETRGVSEAGIVSISTRPDPSSPPGNYMAASGVRRLTGESVAVWDWWSAPSPLSSLSPRGQVEWERQALKGFPRLAVSSARQVQENGSLELHPSGTLSFYTDRAGNWFVRVTSKSADGTSVVDTLYPLAQERGLAGWAMESGDQFVNNHLFTAGDDLLGLTVLSDGRYGTWKVVKKSGALPPLLLEAPQPGR